LDFSEARDLFVNIFQISDLTAKIMDRGLILEILRGLSAKSAKFGLRVDFTKIQAPLRKISEIIRITNYFPTGNPMHGVHTRCSGPVGRCTVDPRWRGQRARRRAHWSLASGHFGAPKLAGRGA
jgi:hypothetical protein